MFALNASTGRTALGLRWWILPAALFFFGTTFILFAIIFPFQIEQEIDGRLAGEFLFDTNSGPGYEKWVTNETPDSVMGWLTVYLYNTTNPDRVKCCSEKPQLAEVGPFYYRQYQRNVNVSFEDLNGEIVVSSTPYIYLLFDESKSVGPQSTLITGPGIGYWSLLANPNVQSNPVLKGQLIQVMQILGSQPYETHTVTQWLFGYTDSLLQFLQPIVPDLIPTTELSLLRNQTSPEDAYQQVNRSTVSCGFPNAARFQQMIRWRGHDNVTFWDPPVKVEGSPGNYFGFRRSGQQEKLLHFFTLVARPVTLYHNWTTNYEGVKVYRYRMLLSESQNLTNNPANAHFNQNKYNGVFNLTSVVGAAIFYSQSHFFGGDNELVSYLDGVRAPVASDEMYLDIDPLTGAVVTTYKSLQSNILFGNFIEPTLGVNIQQQFLHPQIWYVINSQLSDAQMTKLRNSIDFYDRATVAVDVVLYGGAVFGSLLFLLGVWLAHHRREELKKEQDMLLGKDAHGSYDLTYGSHN